MGLSKKRVHPVSLALFLCGCGAAAKTLPSRTHPPEHAMTRERETGPATATCEPLALLPERTGRWERDVLDYEDLNADGQAEVLVEEVDISLGVPGESCIWLLEHQTKPTCFRVLFGSCDSDTLKKVVPLPGVTNGWRDIRLSSIQDGCLSGIGPAPCRRTSTHRFLDGTQYDNTFPALLRR